MEVKNIRMIDLDFYKKYNEWYRYDFYKEKENLIYAHNLKIFDVVRIKHSLSHDIGYRDEIGIVCGLSVSHHVYVFAYNNKSCDFRACGFNEDELIKLNADMLQYKELFIHMKEYLRRNYFNISTQFFKECWLKYRQGIPFEEIVGKQQGRKEKRNYLPKQCSICKLQNQNNYKGGLKHNEKCKTNL